MGVDKNKLNKQKAKLLRIKQQIIWFELYLHGYEEGKEVLSNEQRMENCIDQVLMLSEELVNITKAERNIND
jgi:hypothetical protein